MPRETTWTSDWRRAASPDFSIELPRHIPIDAFDELSIDSATYRRPNADGGRDLFSQRDDTLGHGESMSTAAHHASALTFGAGLVPRAGSDAGEFDPQRPLQGIMHIPADISVFNITRTPKSARDKSVRPAVLQHDAELDKVARSGRFRSHPRETDDALSDASTIARRSDIEKSPKLSHALGRQSGTFSPKRPRTMPITVMPVSTSTPVHRGHATTQHQRQQPQQRVPSGESHASRTASTPTVRDDTDDIHESMASSKFHRLARGVASDLQRAKQDLLRPDPPAPVPARRAPFINVANSTSVQTTRAKTPSRSAHGHRIQLPDVTGISMAVASPMRGGQAYYDADTEESGLDDNDRVRNGQAVQDAIEELASRLANLEGENGVARRRVRELEMELDTCRADVARERTRVLDAEARERKEREKGKARASSNDKSAIWHARYNEVLTEKKNLETLVTRLRTELATMTRQLENHQAIVRELRVLRERDAADMRAKLAEIQDLRNEVDRLGGQAEHLRAVIEDHLRERDERHQSSAESSSGNETASVPASPRPGLSDVVEERTNELRAEVSDEERRRRSRERRRPMSRHEREQAQSRSMRDISPDNEWFHRTDGAIAGSERPTRFINPEEVSRIEEDLTERRVERSTQSNSRFRDRLSPPLSRSPSPQQQPLKSKPVAAPARESRRAAQPRQVEVPLPAAADVSLHGERLQRMFNHAPEHNAQTCTVCHKRRRGDNTTSSRPAGHSAPPELTRHGLATPVLNADEIATETVAAMAKGRRSKLPPQAVLSQVLNELEGDFTHYKGLYIELADQYKLMNPTSDAIKRNLIADQLVEVVELLRNKGNRIAAMYDALQMREQPIAGHGWALGLDNLVRPLSR
ncbi:hypothetical protein BKA62DRAFT_696830 [Auriculariales sp. MPI-PUGE-AT-0066]|nr:hypothetical protein BKA62DRAFT_696830 [Auriculariales sp. MPI-PUGE-AT-0066]